MNTDQTTTAEVSAAPGCQQAPSITVAICSRNRASLLAKAVQSVLAQITDSTEILIVDNASTDETPGVSAAFVAAHSSVSVWREAELGLSAARNAALRRARGQFVLFLDDDAVAEPGWLEAYHRFLSQPPSSRIAVVGGNVMAAYEAPPPQWLPSHANCLRLGDAPTRLHAPGGPWGCNVAFNRMAALQCGGFDTALGRTGKAMGAHEEIELMLRLEQAGFETWGLPEARIQHFFPAERLTFKALWRQNYQEGGSTAYVRLKRLAGANRRRWFTVRRVVIAPFHCAFLLCVALVSVPFRPLQTGARSLLRTARVLGFTGRLIRVRH